MRRSSTGKCWWRMGGGLLIRGEVRSAKCDVRSAMCEVQSATCDVRCASGISYMNIE